MKFKRLIAAVMAVTAMFSAMSVTASAEVVAKGSTHKQRLQYSKDELEEFTEEIVKKANKEDNLWERFKIIYDFVLDSVEYDYDFYGKYPSGYLPDDAGDLLLGHEGEVTKEWCLVNGKAVCSGYADALEYLCEKCDITCVTLSSGKLCHDWNQVRIYNNWYNVDACWSDCAPNKYVWFLKTDAQFAKKHGYSATERRTNPCITEYDINNPPSPPKNFVEDMAIYRDNILYEMQNISDKSSVSLSVGKKVKLSKLVEYDTDNVKVYFSNTKRAKLVKSKSGTLYVKGLKKGPVYLIVVSDGKRTNIKIEIK